MLLTTYEFVMKDKSFLRRTHWQFIIIGEARLCEAQRGVHASHCFRSIHVYNRSDEGHRLKNAHCRFAQVLGQEYTSRNRLLLTGTPLQNNLCVLQKLGSTTWTLCTFSLLFTGPSCGPS